MNSVEVARMNFIKCKICKTGIIEEGFTIYKIVNKELELIEYLDVCPRHIEKGINKFIK